MRTIHARDYFFERAGENGLMSLLVALGDAKAIEEVHLETWGSNYREETMVTKEGYSLFGYFDGVKGVDGTVILSDGRAISCISSREGGDTFQSGETYVRYYILTPKPVVPEKSKKEKKKK